MKLITIDMDALAKAIDSSTDANEQEARAIINTVLAAPMPQPEPTSKGERYCNKCGYFGTDEMHVQPRTGNQCGYLSIECPPPSQQREPQEAAEPLVKMTQEQFIDWFGKNYYGEVVFGDPEWHAKSIYRRLVREAAVTDTHKEQK